MQAFLKNNVVNWNLMSLTGYRTLVILRALFESPKSNDEINEYLFNDQYIKERFSSDTLRMYINSLREIGCEITRANKLNGKRYELISHPFSYDIAESQLKALSKFYKSVYQNISIDEVIAFEDFLAKLHDFIKNKVTKDFLQNLSKLKGVDKDVLKLLINYCNHKNQITFLYNSTKSGAKEISLICDKLSFKSEKLYLWGTNLTHREYSYFLVSRILKICSVNIIKEDEKFLPTKIIYELYNHQDYLPEDDETVIEKTPQKLLIELISRNDFSSMQKFLYQGADCKVIAPVEFKEKLLKKLNSMKESYEKA